MISIRTKQAMHEAKRRGVVLGNPQLAVLRNRDVSNANQQRVQTQQEWAFKIGKVLMHLEETEGLTTCEGLAAALNARGLTTLRGGTFSIPIVSRLRRESKHV
jgi:hypothetical protein